MARQRMTSRNSWAMHPRRRGVRMGRVYRDRTPQDSDVCCGEHEILASDFVSAGPPFRIYSHRYEKEGHMKSWTVSLLFATTLLGQPRNLRLPDEAAGVDAIAQA